MDKRLSIITINYNDAAGLRQTFKSLASQTFKGFELLVIDGGSTDDSLKVIEEHPQLVTSWVSEKDKGIYDAQNKGIRKANGEYLLFLNSGDYLVDEKVLEDFYKFSEGKNGQIIYGDTVLLKANGEFHHYIDQPDPLNAFYFYNNTLNHQSCFIHKKLFDKYGMYKTEYRICADFEFFVNVFIHEPEAYKHFKRYVANYSLGGFSSDPMNYELVVNEKTGILSKYFTAKELKAFRKQYQRQNSLKFNLRSWLYKNKFTYAIIKFYVEKIKRK